MSILNKKVEISFKGYVLLIALIKCLDEPCIILFQNRNNLNLQAIGVNGDFYDDNFLSLNLNEFVIGYVLTLK